MDKAQLQAIETQEKIRALVVAAGLMTEAEAVEYIVVQVGKLGEGSLKNVHLPPKCEGCGCEHTAEDWVPLEIGISRMVPLESATRSCCSCPTQRPRTDWRWSHRTSSGLRRSSAQRSMEGISERIKRSLSPTGSRRRGSGLSAATPSPDRRNWTPWSSNTRIDRSLSPTLDAIVENLQAKLAKLYQLRYSYSVSLRCTAVQLRWGTFHRGNGV